MTMLYNYVGMNNGASGLFAFTSANFASLEEPFSISTLLYSTLSQATQPSKLQQPYNRYRVDDNRHIVDEYLNAFAEMID